MGSSFFLWILFVKVAVAEKLFWLLKGNLSLLAVISHSIR